MCCYLVLRSTFPGGKRTCLFWSTASHKLDWCYRLHQLATRPPGFVTSCNTAHKKQGQPRDFTGDSDGASGISSDALFSACAAISSCGQHFQVESEPAYSGQRLLISLTGVIGFISWPQDRQVSSLRVTPLIRSRAIPETSLVAAMVHPAYRLTHFSLHVQLSRPAVNISRWKANLLILVNGFP
ncbi:hypothetical protein MRX96_025772 [Rhipicephalus microplus]